MHYEVLKSGQAVDSALYYHEIERVVQALVDQGNNPKNTWLIHDNSRLHVLITTQKKIEELGWEVQTVALSRRRDNDQTSCDPESRRQ